MRQHVSGLTGGLVIAAAAILLLTPIRAAEQGPPKSASGWTPLRTADGMPDLQGYWDAAEYAKGERREAAFAADIEAHPPSDFRGAGLTLVVDPPDGKIPYLPAAAARRKAIQGPDYVYTSEIDPHVRCWRNGPPRAIYAPSGFQILQTPGYVIIAGEYSHNYRVIPTDGRPHLGKNIPLFIGDSRGHWEGDTLVVDTTNYNGKFWLDSAGNVTSPALHLVERWAMINPDRIYYEATLEDPTMYARPWKMGFRFVRNKEAGYEQIEFACHEGERSLQNILDVTPDAK